MTETTSWRVVGIPGGRVRPVVLSVATTDPAVIHAIESAAVANGVTLERIEAAEVE